MQMTSNEPLQIPNFQYLMDEDNGHGTDEDVQTLSHGNKGMWKVKGISGSGQGSRKKTKIFCLATSQ